VAKKERKKKGRRDFILVTFSGSMKRPIMEKRIQEQIGYGYHSAKRES